MISTNRENVHKSWKLERNKLRLNRFRQNYAMWEKKMHLKKTTTLSHRCGFNNWTGVVSNVVKDFDFDQTQREQEYLDMSVE